MQLLWCQSGCTYTTLFAVLQSTLHSLPNLLHCEEFSREAGIFLGTGLDSILKLFLRYCSHPFIYFPTFYTVKSVVERQAHPLEHAYNKWRNEIWESCKALWTLWVPAQIINFAFVPRHFRVPFGKL